MLDTAARSSRDDRANQRLPELTANVLVVCYLSCLLGYLFYEKKYTIVSLSPTDCIAARHDVAKRLDAELQQAAL